MTDVTIGDTITDILNGAEPGNFGWLTWAGSPNIPALVTSLTPPGDSHTYVNPNDPDDHTVSAGDWVLGSPGVSNGSAVRQALDTLKTIDIDLPVWDETLGSGSNVQYHIVDIARVRLTDYQLAGENRISARFLGYSCGSGTPTPTPTPAATETPTITPTPTVTDTPTLTPTIELPPGISCFDWHEGAQYGWLQSPWVDSAAQVYWDAKGMYGYVSFGDGYDVGAYFQLPAGGPYKLLLSGQRLEDITVAQGDAAPTGDGPLGETLQISSEGSYSVTESYVEVRWSIQAPTDLATTPIFEGFCFAAFIPTATITPASTSTPSATSTITPPPSQLSDLVVQHVDTAALTVNGQTLAVSGSLSAEIANLGSEPAGKPFTIAFFEDRDGDGQFDDAVDVLLGSVTQNDLAAGTTATVNASASGNILFPGNLVYAFVDSQAVITETNESNNYNHTTGECLPPAPQPFKPVLEWQWTGGTTLPTSKQVEMAPAVADLNQDGIPDIIFVSYAGGAYSTDGHLRAISGQGGTELFTVTNSAYDLRGIGSMAVGDIDLDGRYEILAVDEFGNRLIAFEHNGAFKWRSPSISGGIDSGGPAIADLDGDGTAEVIIGSTVLSNNGVVRWVGSYGRGNNGLGPLSLVADLDMDGRPEIVAGNTAYRADGTVYWRNTTVTDGFNAVADFDADPFPEVVLVDSGKVYLLEHDGTKKWGPVALPGGGDGGAPTIADVDGDGAPEIGVAGSTRYTVFETNGTVKWSSATQDGSSHKTGSSVFDFEADGSAEIIYRDEVKLRVYRGRDGAILWQTPNSSGTAYELPVIADVDADGNAEIVMASNNFRINFTTGIQVYGDAADQWVSTRQLWNQHTYHITNINDDGTIPAHETNNWEIYNNYRLNTLTSGCVFAQPDLTASYVRKEQSETAFVLTTRIGNGGGIVVGANVPVSFYHGDPRAGGNLLGTARTSLYLQPGQFEDITLSLPAGTSAMPLWVVADDRGDGQGIVSESNESNNYYNAHVYLMSTPNQPPTVEAGSDQELLLSGASVSTSLTGTASDDGLPIDQLTHFWTMASGPGEATFADASALETTVSFDQPGAYVLRLTASDDELSAYDEVTITVTAPPTPTPTATVVPTPTIPPVSALVIPGWIGSPANQSTVSGLVPITLAESVTLQDGLIAYWPADDRTDVTYLATNLSGTGGATLATLDTTLLANGSYVIMLSGTDSNGTQQNSGVLISVAGEYKPGRVRFTITDLTVPVVGLPITIGRTYDSLERNRVGDFGHGWSLAIGNPRLEEDQAHNVTLTMPDGKRVTFYFKPQSAGGVFGFLSYPRYIPEAGVYGSLKSNGCGLVVVSGGQWVCFPGLLYQATEYTYTDPYGRKFLMSADGTLKSITDLNGNVLTFTPDGITSSAGGLSVAFERDSQGRITQITDPEGHVYEYGYDGNDDLVSVSLPDVSNPLTYNYADHFFLSAVDPRGHTLITDTYYPDGRLESETDALGNTFHYAYDLPGRTTTVTNPDNGTVVSVYDSYGSLLAQTNPLGHTTANTYDSKHNLLTSANDLGETTSYTYDANGHPTSIKNPLNQTVVTASYNQYGGPASITDGLGHRYSVSYDARFMPAGVSDSLGTLGGYTWDEHGNPLTLTNGENETTYFTYDQYGNLLTQTDSLGNKTTYTYDSLGRVLSVSDPLDHATEYTYDALGRVLTVNDALDHLTQYKYDGNGNLIEVTDPLLRTTVYSYDEANRLIGVLYPDNTTESYTYDWRGNVLTHTDALNHTTQYTYDLAGRLTDLTYAVGLPEEAALHYDYDDAGRVIGEVDPLGNQTLYDYDAAGRLIGITDALNQRSTNTYDVLGQLLTSTDRLDHTTRYQYDARGRQTRLIYVDDTFIQSTYDNAGRLLSSIDQAGHETRYAYDDAGRLIQLITAFGTSDAATTQYLYDAAGRRTDVVDALDHTTHYTYDESNRLLSVRDPLENTQSYTYDDAGQLFTSTDAKGHVTRYTYDPRGRLTQTTYVDGSTTKQAYDALGQLLVSTDQNNKTTSYTYDALGRLLSVTNPQNEAVSYSYDAAGNLLTLTDAKAHQTSFAYDELNRQIRKTLPDNSYETYAYDAAGNRIGHRLADGNVNTFAYDSMNRLETATYFDGQIIGFSYTADGLREFVSDARGLARYFYDHQDRLRRVLQQNGQDVEYTYDANGNRLTLDSAAGTVHYAYDDAGRLTRLTDPAGSVTEFNYDAVGLRTQKALPNGVTTDYSYDDLNRLTGLVQRKNGVSLASFSYSLDAVGNRLAEHSTVNGLSSTVQYQYDDSYRLTDVTSAAYSATYTYDAAGNRLSQTVNGSTTNYTYNELDQMLTAGAIQYQYDGRGNLVQVTNGRDVTGYTYDALNRMTGITLPRGGNTGEIAFAYDADGRRVQQSVGSKVTNYLWDEASVYGDVILESGAGVTTGYVLAGTELLSQTRNGVTSYYLQDGLGSTRAITSNSGTITDTYTYTAFGESLTHTGTTINAYQYTGQQFDSQTGLYSLRARYYNPTIGRFLSQDTFPINFNNPLELNRYVYTANNPINASDPSGNQAFVEYALRGAALGAIGGAISTYACGGNLAENMALGALFGAGLGVLAVYNLPFAFALGTAGGLIGYISAAEDFKAHGPTLCNITSAVLSLLAFTGGMYGGLSGGSAGGLVPVLAGNNGGGYVFASIVQVINTIDVTTVAGTVGLVSMISGGEGGSGDRAPRNRRNQAYPKVKVKGYGEVRFPEGNIENTDPTPMRNQYTKDFRTAFRKWWYDNYGWYPDPEHYELHHILPLAKGGTNSYDNLVPLTFAQHDLFTNWWLYYP